MLQEPPFNHFHRTFKAYASIYIMVRPKLLNVLPGKSRLVFSCIKNDVLGAGTLHCGNEYYSGNALPYCPQGRAKQRVCIVENPRYEWDGLPARPDRLQPDTR
jgi:hypothetical protein